MKFCLPFVPSFPAILSLVNGQKRCLPFSFNSINTLKICYSTLY
nr:MAG TPA: hypothetical protein [Caudoviricetes sp.]